MTDPIDPKSRPGVAVLDKALVLLRLVANSPAPMSFTRLQQVSGLPKATLHRISGALIGQGMLRVEAKDRTYRLGLQILEFAHRVWADFDLPGAAAPELVRLRDETGETVRLAVRENAEAVIVASEEPRQGLRLASAVGERLPLHATAIGKALASALPAGDRRRLLESIELPALTAGTLHDHAAVLADLDLARGRGYALEAEEFGQGLNGVSAPILDVEGLPIGAIGVSGPAFRLPVARLHELAPALIAAARRVSHNAGGSTMSIAVAPRPSGADRLPIRTVLDTRALLGEGPFWESRTRTLFWVDILAPAVHRLDPKTGEHATFATGSMVSMVIARRRGGTLVATRKGLAFLDVATGTLEAFVHPESDRPGNRYNDGKCDSRGRLWVGSLDVGTVPNRGSLVRVGADGQWQRMDSGFTVANGLGWSPDDRSMYFTDSFRRTVYIYDFDCRRGLVSNRRPFIEFSLADGSPDGIAVDAEGCLWIAMWDGWTIVRVDPAGRVVRRIELPVPRPTSLCFGGQGLKTLFVTTASVRLPAVTLNEAPLSGALLAFEPGVRGLPVNEFGG